MVNKIIPEKDAAMRWQTQAGNITTNIKVNVDFNLPALSAKNVVTWKCQVDGSAKGRYDQILGRDILTELVLNLKCYNCIIRADGGHFIGATTPMVDLGAYLFKDLNTGNIKP